MIELGFDDSFVCEYTGSEEIFYVLNPSPIISFALKDPQEYAVNKKIDELLNNVMYVYLPKNVLLFREDSFDPITRIRRGRFYEKSDNVNPRECRVSRGIRQQDQNSKLTIFKPYWKFAKNQLIAIGSADSVWRVIVSDRISTGEFLVTLKSRNNFGVIPEIDKEKIPEKFKEEIVLRLDNFVDVVNRETPSSIVDATRDIAVLLIGSYTYANDEKNIAIDLGDLIKKLKDCKKELSAFAATIINHLHPRNKSNEKIKYNLRSITEEDSELSVCLIGLLLQEFGWTK
ncbi:MAG: hypothetical protein ACYCT7_02765 [bacterium]